MKASPKSKSRARGKQPRKTVGKSAPSKTTGQANARTVQATAPERRPAPPARLSKKAAVITLLQRPQGAAIDDLTEATGWRVHSVRAALSGLRKEGKDLVRAKDAAGTTRYRLEAQA